MKKSASNFAIQQAIADEWYAKEMQKAYKAQEESNGKIIVSHDEILIKLD